MTILSHSNEYGLQSQRFLYLEELGGAPVINSNAKAPATKQHKRIMNQWGRHERPQIELQNENSKIKGKRTVYHDDEEVLDSDGDEDDDEDNEFDRDCNEASVDADVHIWETHSVVGPSTHECRRSSRLNDTEAPIVGGADN